MYRCISIAVIVVLLSGTAASGDGLDGTEIIETPGGLVVTAASVVVPLAGLRRALVTGRTPQYGSIRSGR